MANSEDTNAGNSGASSSAFLNKLLKIVSDPQTDHLIKWSKEGNSFVILDEIKFCQEILPKYFKHKNMASFIRQLHMYRFKKVFSVDSGGLTMDKGEIEFYHPYFIRADPSLIESIKRKPQVTKSINSIPVSSSAVVTTDGKGNVNTLLSEVQKLRNDHETMRSQLLTIKGENDILWREHNSFKVKFSKQQQIIEKLVNFLVALVKSPGPTIAPKRKYNYLALEGGSSTSDSPSNAQNIQYKFQPSSQYALTGPVIQEVTHLEEGDPQSYLEKVFKSTPSISSTEHKRGPSSINDALSIVNEEPSLSTKTFKRETRNHETFPQKHAERNKSDASGISWTDGEDLLIGNEEQTSDINSQINPSTSSYAESPNGTLLETYEPPLSPDMMQTVNPSEVTPNIVVATYPHQNESNNFYRGRDVVQKEKDFAKNLDDSLGEEVSNKSFFKSRKSKMPVASKNYSAVGIGSEDDGTVNKTVSDIAIPENYEKSILMNRLDEVQSSLDSLKDILNSGNLNVDTSAILSIFDNEDRGQCLPNNDFQVNQQVLGNELSVYNPGLYDLEDVVGDANDSFNFASLIEEDEHEEEEEETETKRKKPRLHLNVKREKPSDDDEEDILATPKPHFNASKYI